MVTDSAPPFRIALTTGEPAGIGPDVCLLAAGQHWEAQLVAIGDRDLLAARAQALKLDVQLRDYQPHCLEPHQPGTLTVLHRPLLAPCKPGQLEPANAPYVLQLLDQALAGLREGAFQAMVTAPVQKSVINEAGIAFSGHTEYLAMQTDTRQVVMMLASDQLRVALATTHLPLKEVAASISQESLETTLRILHGDLRRHFGLRDPHITVLGLNPHAGESGHLGREEIDIISPVLATLRKEGMNLSGPLPADTAFSPERLENSDAFLAMYHDQGLPVLKYSAFGEAVNITLGLPVLRTSVDHGTALELAATGTASPGSLYAAIRMAIDASRAKGDTTSP